MSAGPPTDDSSSEEWDPTFPWERGGDWLRSTPRGRFVAFNVLVFVLLGVAFALPNAVRALTRPDPGRTVTVTTVPSLGDGMVQSLYLTTSMAPLLAVVMGILAGLYFVSPSESSVLTGAIGVAAGYLSVFLLLAGAAVLVDGGRDAIALDGRGLFNPLLIGLGTVLAGGGAAALTRRFVPTAAID